MDTIPLIHHQEDGGDWANYLTDLSRRHNFNFHPRPVSREKEVSESNITCLLLTPCLADYIYGNSKSFFELVKPCRDIMLLLCNVVKEDFEKKLTDYPVLKTWKVHTVGSDESGNEEVIKELSQRKNLERTRCKPLPFLLFPSEIFKQRCRIAVVFCEIMHGRISLKCGNQVRKGPLKRENPYTFTFQMSDLQPGENKVKVFIDGICCGTKTLTYRAPSVFSSLDYLAQLMNVDPADVKEIDRRLAQLFQESVPADGSLNILFSEFSAHAQYEQRSEKMPTLLHFAASYGLEELCSVILATPGSVCANRIINSEGLDAVELAEESGFTELAEYIRMFLDTEEVVNAIDDLYVNKAAIQSHADGTANAMKTRPPVPLPRCKSLQREENIPLSPPTPFPRSPSLQQESEERIPLSPPTPFPRSPSLQQESEETFPLSPPTPFPRTPTLHREPDYADLPDYVSSSSLCDLAEINAAVARREFTIDEGIRLYDSWKKRNEFSSSLKENKEKLQKMRDEFKGIFESSKVSENKNKRGIFGTIKNKLTPKTKKKESFELRISEPVAVSNIYDRMSSVSSCSSTSYSSRDSHLSRDSSLGTSIDEEDSVWEEEYKETRLHKRPSSGKPPPTLPKPKPRR